MLIPLGKHVLAYYALFYCLITPEAHLKTLIGLLFEAFINVI